MQLSEFAEDVIRDSNCALANRIAQSQSLVASPFPGISPELNPRFALTDRRTITSPAQTVSMHPALAHAKLELFVELDDSVETDTNLKSYGYELISINGQKFLLCEPIESIFELYDFMGENMVYANPMVFGFKESLDIDPEFLVIEAYDGEGYLFVECASIG